MNTAKLKLFFRGRKGLLPKIEAACGKENDIIWFHTASYGEFEEARPVIEATRERFPERKILLTVFSPTVYEPKKHYDKVDWVFYLPLDTPSNVRRFLDAVRPSIAIFNIGEIWPCLLHALRRRQIPTFIMSVRMEPDSPYLKWYGGIYRRILRECYDCIMVQNEQSRRLLEEQIGAPVVKVVGDARVDRVLSVATTPWNDAKVDNWTGGEKVFIGGNTYPVEDRMLVEIANAHPEGRFMIIPHNPAAQEVQDILQLAKHGAVLYSDYSEADAGAQILVVNTVGMLARLYRYGYACYVGGAFADAMPHSVVEPASFGMPISFGPKFDRELHCKDLAALGAGSPIANTEQLDAFFQRVQDASFRENAAATAQKYTRDSAGATQRIMQILFG